MEKNRLYIANKWNRPAFMPKGNIFWPGGNLTPEQFQQLKLFNISAGVTPSTSSTYSFGLTTPNLSAPTVSTPSINWGNSTQVQNTLAQSGKAINNFAENTLGGLGIDSKSGGFSNFLGGIGDKLGGIMGGGQLAGTPVGGLAGSLGSAVGGLAGNTISGGLQSNAGNAISGIGSTIGGAIGSVNPVLGGIVSVGSGIIGGVTNALFGTKVDEAKLKAANEGTDKLKNFTSTATSFDDIKGPEAVAEIGNVYSGGLFSSSKARRKNEELKRLRREAESWANRSVINNVNNIDTTQMDNLLANYSAFGGPLFAIGGDLQTNGSDFTSGLTHIGAGGQHETNPYEGVQMGVDQEGTPNLVEENETVWNDYVFSNRIPIDQTTKELFHIGKKREMTYADLSKKLEKEIAERPNDPISKAGFEKQMQMLEEQQERQKQEMEAERAKAAFDAMSPEEQVAVMDGAAQQQAMAEQAAMQQSSPEEMTMMQQQQMVADGTESNLGQEPEMMAFGGKVNRFDEGGKAYSRMLNSLGFHTQKEFDDWAKEHNIDLSKVWSDDDRTLNNDILSALWKDENFKKALQEKNPALAHAFREKGYDFGAYQPSKSTRATIQSISKGNWKTTNGKGWRGSEDLAFKQATQGMSDEEIDALTTEQLAERMKNTEAYKNTNKWLENSDNALMYLNTLLNDPDTPQVAKDYAAKFVKDDKWKDGFTYDYGTVFGKDGKGVRETNPGTYWHSAMEANRGNQAGNFVINEDGSVEPIIGDVPTDWTPAGNYAWADEDNDYAYNYYKRPVVASPSSTPPAEEETPAKEDEKKIVPRQRWEGLRYAGLFGPAVGLGLQMAGVGKPDTAQLDAAIEGAGNVKLASWKPLGNYMRYTPMDIWYEQNALNAQSRATDRALMNTSGGNRGTAMAGLLANGYNSQIASGNLYRKALEYNDAKRKEVAEFNRDTDKWNSDQFGRTSQFNASAMNDANQRATQLRLNAAAHKMDADAGWYQGIYGNLSGLFKGLSDLGRENVATNWRNGLVTSGAMGVADEDALVAAGIAKYKNGKKKSKGGKVNKKRGLTF